MTAKLKMVLLALFLTVLTAPAASADDAECDASVIDVLTIREGTAAPGLPGPDVYFAPTDQLEITAENTFRVYRPSEVNDTPTRHYPLLLYVGRLQVVEVQGEAAIGRMIEFASTREYPRVRHATVMIGDCLKLDAVEEEPFTVTTDALPAETLDIDGLKLGKIEEPKPTRIIPTRVLFEFDKSVVREMYADDLARLAGYIAEEKPDSVVIEGHADWIGTDEYNVALSERRARAIVDYLVARHGIGRPLFEVRAYGESRPEATNETSEGRRRNRRAATALFFKVVPTVAEPAAPSERRMLIRPDELEPDDAKIPQIPTDLPEIEENPEDL